MINLDNTIAKLAEQTSTSPQHIEDAAKLIIEQIYNDGLKIKELVIKLNPLLTAGNHELRLRGVDLLSQVITNTEHNRFNEKEIEVFTEYLSDRLSDHKSMQAAVLRSFLYFISCENKPRSYNHDILEHLKQKSNVHNMDRENRLLVYRLLREIIIEKRRNSASIDSDLFYSLIHLIEGESEPENLMSCFGIISYVMKSFANLEPFVDDMFEWLASYYPLDYTPDKNDTTKSTVIQKLDLTKALYECFYATPLNSENLQTLMLEKIDSNQPKSTKIESLNCLIELYEIFPSVEVKDYATTLWTSIRANCLMKVDMVDPILMETCYRALSAMTKRLNDDSYFTFISEMYEELSIAIRKLEMDLFEPAIRLIVHAIQPRVVGFNFILTKILPIAIKAINISDLRPAAGLTYIFEHLFLNHPDAKVVTELDGSLNELILQISSHAATNEDCLKLLNSIVCCKVRLSDIILNEVIGKLQASSNQSIIDTEESLALICTKYHRSDIIFTNVESDLKIDSLMKLVNFYREEHQTDVTNETKASKSTKFSIYLRLLVSLLDDIDCLFLNHLGRKNIDDFLKQLRSLVVDLESSHKHVENVGLIHAIIINKISEELVQPIIIDIFQSEYCQKLIPDENCDDKLSCNKYLPVVGLILKSLVLRNHQLVEPMVNLILNFITSDRISQASAIKGAHIFSQVLSDCRVRFEEKKQYQIFVLHKQKFFTLAVKNIKKRLELPMDNSKENLLIGSVALQIPHLAVTIYKKDSEWIVREILKILTALKNHVKREMTKTATDETLIPIIYECVEYLIASDCSDIISSFLGSFVELNLFYATEAQNMQIRRRALVCLSIIATSFNESQLLVLRSSLLKRLKPCLSDKKRIVRQSAAEARLKWFLVGQPVGSL